MSDAPLKLRLADETKTAMKARDKERLAVLRLVGAELKRVEVDERRDLSDDDIIAILTRMRKQRADSLAQYEAANREDLAAQERFEIDVVESFLPEALSEAELAAAVTAAIAEVGAAGPQDMGKVMALLKSRVAGRADLGQVSKQVKAALST
ncbi:MAG: GatB/YqeY domain-containing protein [Pseudomonadota bacterium]